MFGLRNGYPWRFSAFLMTYYVANGIYQGYAPKYFQSVGITSYAQMSVLLAATPIISIAMQPVWGLLGDRMKSRNQVLRILTCGATAALLLFAVSRSFWWLLPLSMIFSAFFTAIQPMGDSIILESLADHGQPFGPLRLTACLSFAVTNLGLGVLFEGRFSLVPPLTALMLAVLFASTYALPPTPGHQSAGCRMSIPDLFKIKDMAGLLVLLMLLQLSMGYFYSFFSVHFTSLPGGTMTLLGACYFISATSEVPFLLNADRLFERLGAGKLMCISAAALTARWLILATCQNVYVVMASQLLHGWGFIVMTVSMSKYVNLIVPPELKASGQMLLAVVGFGIARTFGILGGGLLSDALGGIGKGFYFTAAITGIGLIIFAPKYLRREALNGSRPERAE